MDTSLTPSFLQPTFTAQHTDVGVGQEETSFDIGAAGPMEYKVWFGPLVRQVLSGIPADRQTEEKAFAVISDYVSSWG